MRTVVARLMRPPTSSLGHCLHECIWPMGTFGLVRLEDWISVRILTGKPPWYDNLLGTAL
jgi:hypothetical protein